MNNSYKIFKSLKGNWRINRTIIGPDNTKIGSALGEAVFLHKLNTCEYEENVETEFSHGKVKGSQNYLYKFNKINSVISKHSPDGKMLYELNIESSDRAIGEFICEKDEYKATYNFIDNANFIINYLVKGPNKNYKISTQYQKINQDS